MMKKPIIEVKNLTKTYKIGIDRTYKTFSESTMNIIKSPFKSLRNLTKNYDEFRALDDVSFTINHGDVLGIIGKNGAGKSTLLKVISGITWPTQGEITLRGRVGSLLEVGTGFHPELTGRDNIFFNGAILGMRKNEIEGKFDEIVKFSGVEKFLDTPVKRYSSGMQVRLAFSVAAHLEPEILVVDEVLAVGDAQFQKKCLGKMEQISKGDGKTVLFVSHNMEAVRKLCSRCIHIDAGKIKQDGESQDVIRTYLELGKSEKNAEFFVPRKTDAPISVYKTVLEKIDGTSSSSFNIGEGWQIRLFVSFAKEIESASFGLSMIKNGQSIRATYSQAKNYSPGEYQIVFRETSVFLTTGIYKFHLRIRSYGNIIMTYDDIGTVEITEVSAGLDSYYRVDVGIIVNPMEVIFYDGDGV